MSRKVPTTELIGRKEEYRRLNACMQAGRNIMLEGPVGAGKTHLALAVIAGAGRLSFRVDGDSRYTEQKLTGWFDPPAVMKKGFTAETFVAGPLVEAMRTGGVLFINELNRLPEGVQNVLLPAIDEGLIHVPRLGEIRAKPGFLVIATQNPKEFVATSHLSEAILDRFELVTIDYQPEEEELQIVSSRLAVAGVKHESWLPAAAVRLARLTREHDRIRRGASVRAAMGIAELCAMFLSSGGMKQEEAFTSAAMLALPTRIELEPDAESGKNPHAEMEELVNELALLVLKKKR